ncbi:hypothetical protein NE237_022792 [Protea cynaroides]|uniref:B30.2/SPRY domain-containing protein n=1 Tax=Protea cynaroides TaxID=273540 RepID=A0A9Q0K649_9MAGN|nr:hypothetical protein NE237_022792 [Protea cynaroides]
MPGSANVIAAALSAAIIVIILIVFIWQFCYTRRLHRMTDTTKTGDDNFQSGIEKLPMTNDSCKDPDIFSGFQRPEVEGRPSYSLFRNGILPKISFNWADHPWLVSEAVELGWPRFAFRADVSSPSPRSNLLGLCAVGDEGRETETDITWEMCPESVDFMQKIKFNPVLKKNGMGTSPLGVSCVTKSALPLPGPPLENNSFPQESYFEITIVSCPQDGVDFVHRVKRSPVEGELTKLIPQTDDANGQSDSLIQEVKLRNTEGEGQKEMAMLSVGLSGGGSLLKELPGSYLGSIGFNSNGSLFLDGIKLVFEAEKTGWESKGKVIGCGFDPSQKKVFFTVDSELVHVINCKSEEFSSPLYPTIAANVDIIVMVNFGQSAFQYSPANAQRTPNPCFICPPPKGSPGAVCYEDSRDLFSMGIVPYSSWNNNNGDMSPARTEATELFEIPFSGPAMSNAGT